MGTTHPTTVQPETPSYKNMNTLIVLAALVACTVAAPTYTAPAVHTYAAAPAIHHAPAVHSVVHPGTVQYHHEESSVPVERHYTTVEKHVGEPVPYLAGPVQRTVHYGTELQVTGQKSVIHKPKVFAPRIGVPTTLLNRVYHNPAEVSVDSYTVNVNKPVPNPVPYEVEVLGEPIIKHVEVEGHPIVKHTYAQPTYTHTYKEEHVKAAAPVHHGYAALPALHHAVAPAVHHGYAALPAVHHAVAPAAYHLQPHHAI